MDTKLKLNSEGLSFGDFIKVLKTRWSLITLILLLVISSAMLFTYFAPKWYLSTTSILVEKPEGQVSVFERQIAGSFDPYFNKQQFEIIQGKIIIAPVIENLDLINYLSRELGGPIDEEFAYQYIVKKMLLVESRPGTSMIDIGVMVKGNPDKAAEIANEIARFYAENRIKLATSAQTEGIDRLNEELKLQEVNVSRERDKVEKLRQELQISGVDINAQTTQLDIDNLRQLERTYIAVKIDSIARKTRWEQFKAVPVDERFKLINAELIPDQNLQNLMQAYLVAEQQHVRIKGRLGEAHPDFVGAEATLEKIREQLTGQLIGFEKSLEISYIESKARTEEMENQLKNARVDQILDAQSKMRPFQEAVDKLRDEENLLQTFRLTLRQREIDFQAPKRTIEIINEAVPSLKPHKPNPLLNTLLSVIGGVILGIGAAFLSEFFDTSFRSVEDMERKLQLPILGVISHNLIHLENTNFSSFEAEPYRVIQTNMELAREGKKGNVLVVQSAGPGEGKSTTLYNLAAAMALTGQRVLVIDSDLRRPSQHHLFKTSRTPGLIDCLTGLSQFSEAVKDTSIPNLHFLPSGQGKHFSLGLLHGKQLANLLQDVRQHYDKVLLDSPPVIGISDSSLLASLADGVVFIVQHRRNPQTMTQRAKQIIENVNGNILGVVLNQVPDSGDEDYNYYTSNYYYYSHKKDPGPNANDYVSSFDEGEESLEFEESEPTNYPKV